MFNLWQDLRYAARTLRKSPGFTVVAVMTLALGIGATTAIFAFVDAALLKPLPYRNASQLVAIFNTTGMERRNTASYLDFLDWKAQNKAFTSIDVYAANGGFTLNTMTGAQQVPGTRVSPGFFRTLGVSPMLGRDFRPDENSPSSPYPAMLSYDAWQKWFGGKPDVLGKTAVLYGIPNTIIGVLPRNFHFAPAGSAEFWGLIHASDYCERMRGCRNLGTVARLKSDTSIQTALANMKSVTGQLAQQYPNTNRDIGANVIPLSEVIVGDIRPILLTLLGGAGLLLLIACINVSGLLLARSDRRRREIAVRGALGAAPARLIWQFATEGLVLSAAGGIFGLMLALSVMRLLTKLIPGDKIGAMPYFEGLSLNVHGVVFAGAIFLAASTLFAATPLLRVSLSNLREGLAEGGRGSAGTMWRRFGSNLVALELAIATVLLVSAGLLGESLHRLLREDIGMLPNHLATLQIEGPKGMEGVSLEREVEDRIGGLPGVKSVGIANALPVSSGWGTAWFEIANHPDLGDHNEAIYRQVSAGYFSTLQARLLRGRYFDVAEDVSKFRAAIVNRAMAKKYFPGEDPVGKQIFFFQQPKTLMRIVGVVDNVREGPLDTDSAPVLYVPFQQDPWRGFAIVVRTSQAEQSLLPTLAKVIHGIDSGIAVHDEITMTDLINQSPSAYLHRSSAWLVGSFATIAFLLSVIGLYSVIAYSVSQRTREIGVRMALGAQRKAIYELILKEAGWLIVLGMATGVVGSLAAAKLIRGLLFGIQPWDMPTLLAVVAVLGVSALLASYIPARRAAKVDPMVALRYE